MFDPTTTALSEGVIAARLLLAVGLGAVIGFEREQLARPAGLRTHMLTALAAALFTIITMEIHAGVMREGAGQSTDPIRIIGDQSDERSTTLCTTTIQSTIPTLPRICTKNVSGPPPVQGQQPVDSFVWDNGNGNVNW